MTADLDLGNFSREFDNNLAIVTLIPDEPSIAPEQLITQMPVSIDILTFKVDYSRSLSEKWKVKLSMQDLLHSNQVISYGEAPGFMQYHRIAFDSRVVMLSVTYSFGNQKLKSTRQRKTGSEEEMKRTN